MLVSITNEKDGSVTCKRYIRGFGMVHEWNTHPEGLKHLEAILIAFFFQ